MNVVVVVAGGCGARGARGPAPAARRAAGRGRRRPGGGAASRWCVMSYCVMFSCHVMLQVIRESRKHRDSHNTTLMLVIVIGLFLMTEIPLLVITVLHTLDNRSPYWHSLSVCILVSQQYNPSLKILQVSSVAKILSV